MMLIEKANKNKKGFSLVELLAVLGVGGAMVAGALTLVSNVQTKREVKLHSENISTIFNNMQNLFANESMDSTVTTTVLVTAGVFPNQLNIDTSATPNVVKTPGGGSVTITPNADGFTLNYGKISSSSCVEVVKAQRDVGWDSYEAGKSGSLSGTDFNAATVVSISSACDTSVDWNDLTFTLE